MRLRDYQVGAIDALRGLLREGKKKLLLQAATGSGKTLIAASIIQSAVARGNKCLFVAHRKEIVAQTSSKLDLLGVSHGVIMSGYGRYKPYETVQVASVQTLSNRHKPEADIVFFDECHLSMGASFMALAKHYSGSVIIGLTATPIRLDGKGLGGIYTDMVQVVPVAELIASGYLVKPRVFAPFTPDMGGVSLKRGDYDASGAALAMDKAAITGDIVAHWKKYGGGLKTICFAASVKHSENIRDAFVAAGVKAKHLDGKTPAKVRDRVLQEWRDGRFSVLVNCGLFIEGLDVPEAACCILARPTKSLTIYLQSVGRVLRPYTGKEGAIILDHAGLTYEHGLITEDRAWTLQGKEKRKRSDGVEGPISVTICESCFAAFSRVEYPHSCPECGAALPVRAREVMEGDGDLVELDEAAMAAIRQRKKDELKAAKTYEELMELARRRGYKAGWAVHILRQREQWKQNYNNRYELP